MLIREQIIWKQLNHSAFLVFSYKHKRMIWNLKIINGVIAWIIWVWIVRALYKNKSEHTTLLVVVQVPTVKYHMFWTITLLCIHYTFQTHLCCCHILYDLNLPPSCDSSRDQSLTQKRHTSSSVYLAPANQVKIWGLSNMPAFSP